MATNLRNRAEVLAIGLEIGAQGVDDVVAWADSVIVAEQHPHGSVCELAMMGRSHARDVIWALRDVPGDLDETWVVQEVVRQLAGRLAEDRSRADQIASALYELARAEELPDDELRSIGWWALDSLSLADDRTVQETRDQVVDMILDALRVALSERLGRGALDVEDP